MSVFTPKLPVTIGFSTVKLDSVKIADLLAEEYRALSLRANSKRQREYTAGRVAARQALKLINAPSDQPVLRNEDRSPIWPVGYCGSISHASEYAVAIAGSKDQFSCLGLDLEKVGELREVKIAERIADNQELAWIKEKEDQSVLRTIMLFSAKEAYYKAVYPTVKTYFGYNAINLQYVSNNCFKVKIQNPILEHLEDLDIDVDCQLFDGYVLSTFIVPK